jgi:hypothetical protein
MRRNLKYVVLIPLTLVAFIAAFFFYDHYEILIRWLYVFTTKHKISFFVPRKYFVFASNLFCTSFAVFCTVIGFIMLKWPQKRNVVYLLTSVLVFFLTTLVASYITSNNLIATCTACNNGTRTLHWGEVNYDLIFVISLTMALISLLIGKFRKSIV